MIKVKVHFKVDGDHICKVHNCRENLTWVLKYILVCVIIEWKELRSMGETFELRESWDLASHISKIRWLWEFGRWFNLRGWLFLRERHKLFVLVDKILQFLFDWRCSGVALRSGLGYPEESSLFHASEWTSWHLPLPLLLLLDLLFRF